MVQRRRATRAEISEMVVDLYEASNATQAPLADVAQHCRQGRPRFRFLLGQLFTRALYKITGCAGDEGAKRVGILAADFL